MPFFAPFPPARYSAICPAMAALTVPHSAASGSTTTGSTILRMVSGSVKFAPSCERSAGSRPRSNRVPKIDGSMGDQSSFAAASNAAISVVASGTDTAVSNRPPLNQGISSSKNSPPPRMDANSSVNRADSLSGWPALFSTMRSNRCSGSRPTSSANMQNRHWIRN